MRVNPDVRDCAAAPIHEAWTWAEGRDPATLIDACQAVPTTPPPQTLQDHVADAVRAGGTRSYTEIAGIAPLRDALSEDLTARYQAALTAEDVIITSGCNQAFCTAIDTHCRAGDEVVLPVPFYFNHDMWLRIRGVTPRYLQTDAAMQPSVDAAADLITASTRAIVLVTPNNPTGALYPLETIAAFFDLAQTHGLTLIVDETYRDYTRPDHRPHDLFGRPDWRETLVHLYSFSKAYSLPGYRVGAMVCGSNTRANAIKVQDCTAICAPHASQIAALYALENLSSFKRDAARQMAQRASAFKAAFADCPGGFSLQSAGAYFAYVRHPFENRTGLDVARHLARDQGLITLPGAFFGPGQDRYLRLAMSNVDEKRLGELTDRLKASS